MPVCETCAWKTCVQRIGLIGSFVTLQNGGLLRVSLLEIDAAGGGGLPVSRLWV